MNLTDKEIKMLWNLLQIREGWRAVQQSLDEKARQKLDGAQAKEVIRRGGIVKGVEIIVEDMLSRYNTSQDEIEKQIQII